PRIYDRIQVYWKARDYAKAAEILQQVLLENRKSGSIDDRYEALGGLCTAYVQLGDTDKAVAACDERLALLRANRAHFAKSLFPGNTPGGGDGFVPAEAENLEQLGRIYSALGNHARALQDLHQS